MSQKTVQTLDIRSWDERVTHELQENAIRSLEEGKILYFPNLAFPVQTDELSLLTPEILSPKAKNISYDAQKAQLHGAFGEEEQKAKLQEMMDRFSKNSVSLIKALFPQYTRSIKQAKTSYRPVEIFGRKTSYRKDDTRLHVDSFPSNPMQGHRILRVFSNVNPEGKARVWRSGEPFSAVVKKIAPRVKRPLVGWAELLQLFKVTKSYRTPYDHYMLQIHDEMKRDTEYQKNVDQEEIHFPPGTSWAVYTDVVSHAAMRGQHVLEQTYSLPVEGMLYPELSPLKVLEAYFKKQLI